MHMLHICSSEPIPTELLFTLPMKVQLYVQDQRKRPAAAAYLLCLQLADLPGQLLQARAGLLHLI